MDRILLGGGCRPSPSPRSLPARLPPAPFVIGAARARCQRLSDLQQRHRRAALRRRRQRRRRGGPVRDACRPASASPRPTSSSPARPTTRPSITSGATASVAENSAGQHDRLSDRRDRCRRRPDHLFADRRRRGPAHHRRQRRGPADHAGRFRDQERAIRSTSSPAIPAALDRAGRSRSPSPTSPTAAATPIINETAGANDGIGSRAGDRPQHASSSPTIPTCPTTTCPRRPSAAASRRRRRQGFLRDHAAGRRAADPRHRRDQPAALDALLRVYGPERHRDRRQ